MFIGNLHTIHYYITRGRTLGTEETTSGNKTRLCFSHRYRYELDAKFLHPLLMPSFCRLVLYSYLLYIIAKKIVIKHKGSPFLDTACSRSFAGGDATSNSSNEWRMVLCLLVRFTSLRRTINLVEWSGFEYLFLFVQFNSEISKIRAD